jgi:hypothetical protein
VIRSLLSFPSRIGWKDRASKKLLENRIISGECWLWSKCKNKSGYGRLGIDGRVYLAHRLSYRVFVGPIGEMGVLHRCDTRACFNPSHLFKGTQQDNLRDMRAKNRAAVGSRSALAKLTESQVLEIRADTRLYREIAADYGITKNAVFLIRKRTCWKHI